MKNPLAYHRAVENEQHVFLLCIKPRSSSTAFQRIINSSNTVWIWGEPRGLINQIANLSQQIKNVGDNEATKLSISQLYHSYNDNKHMLFYPNAIGNSDTTVELVNSAISNLLKPWAPKLKRFGFKDVEQVYPHTLEFLKATYPRSYFMFCFRDPLKQWPSVCKLFLENNITEKNLEVFLNQYYWMAKGYIDFSKKNNIISFIENEDLKNVNSVNKIINYLNIPMIDLSLINDNVGSLHGDELENGEEEIILKSDAYKIYNEMKSISKSFYEFK
ncbi:MAG TPA: hypothetical protein VL490_08695 [Mucilaginibacter sp.]|jgi:hypothetical protein|nr:hypothetical protein [Mucilaginibacter sp.]